MTMLAERKPLAFKVQEQALFTGTQRIETHKAIVREDNNHVLGIVGQDYTYVQNEDLLRPFHDALKRAGLGEMVIQPRLYNQGAWWRCDFITPKLKAEPIVGDIVQFRASVINSFDMSSPVQVMYGAQRLVCLNGMTADVHGFNASRRHTKGLPSFDFTEYVQSAVDAFQNNARHWQAWEREDVSRNEAHHMLSTLMSEKLAADAIFGLNIHPLTLWVVYNIATAWASHETMQPVRTRTDRGVAKAMHQRELDVMQWVRKWPDIRKGFANT